MSHCRWLKSGKNHLKDVWHPAKTWGKTPIYHLVSRISSINNTLVLWGIPFIKHTGCLHHRRLVEIIQLKINLQVFRNHTPKWIQYVFLWKWFIKIGTSTDLIIAPNFETEPRPKAAIKTVLSLYQAAQGEQFKGWPKEPPGLSWHPGKPETPNDWTESGVFPSGWIIYLQHIGLDVRMTTLHNFKHHSSMYLGEIFHDFTTLKCQIMFRGFTLIQPNCILLVGKWGPPFQSKHLRICPTYQNTFTAHQFIELAQNLGSWHISTVFRLGPILRVQWKNGGTTNGGSELPPS